MKKVIKWFNKKKNFSINSHDLAADAVPEPPRNMPRYVPKQINLHKTFGSNDCCSSNHKTGNDNSDNVTSEVTEEPVIISDNERDQADLNSQPTQVSNEAEETERPSSPSDDLVEEISRLPVAIATNQESQGISMPEILSENSSDDIFSRGDLRNNMAVQEADAAQELSNTCIPKKLFDDRKTGGNTYVITISKSTNFHIGTQKTINYPGMKDNSVHKREFPYTNISNGKILAVNENQLLDIKETLSEDDLVQISLSIRNKWQEFARNLGIDESTVDELKELNDNDYNLIVYDILKQYLSRYPDTTVGFMVSVLRKCNETEAIRKLVERR